MGLYLMLGAVMLPVLCIVGAVDAGEDAGLQAPGAVLRLYDIDSGMQWLPDLAPGQRPNVVRIVPLVDFGAKPGDFAPFEDNFLTEVSGFIRVEQEGTYTFRLISDDGAHLWIEGRLVVDHDGLHGPDPKDGTVTLDRGHHSFRVRHFEAGGGQRLALLWRPPGEKDESGFVLIPSAALSHDVGESQVAAPGKKRIIPALRKGVPGDGTEVAGVHPAFARVEKQRPPGGLLQQLRSAMEAGTCALEDGSLVGMWHRQGTAGGSQLRSAGRPGDAASGRLLVWLPAATGADRPSVPCLLKRGMYAGQLLVGDAQTGGIKRLFLDPVVDEMQGCVFRFSAGVADHVSALASAPDGSILVAPDPRSELSLVDVLKPANRSAFEMRAVRAMSNGLSIEFTEALDPRVGWDPESYYVEQWPWRQTTGEGRPTRDGSSLPVKSASVSQSGKQVFLEIDGLKEEHLVYLRLLPPCLSQDGAQPWSTEAWYTLKAIPRGRIGTILPPPPIAPQNVLTAEERAAGWRLLFDGKTTRGWRGFRKDHMPDGWQVIKGCLVRMGPGGDIITEQQFDDFELTLEWRISPGGNSGIFFRVSEEENVVWRTGPEMQVLDNSAHADGRNALTSAGANYALHAPVRDVTEPVGLFNKVRVLVDCSHVEHWLNGVKIVEYELESPEWERLVAASKFKSMPRHGRTKKGHIALQDHGDKVWYRNIKIRAIDHD
jgi:hypothetical protein